MSISNAIWTERTYSPNNELQIAKCVLQDFTRCFSSSEEGCIQVDLVSSLKFSECSMFEFGFHWKIPELSTQLFNPGDTVVIAL